MPENKMPLKTKTTVVLNKFEGDGPPDRTDQPLETIVIEDGVIISHVVNRTINAAH